MTEYLEFNELIPNKPIKTKIFEVKNKITDYYLGDIKWDFAWRQYVFIQRTDEDGKN